MNSKNNINKRSYKLIKQGETSFVVVVIPMASNVHDSESEVNDSIFEFKTISQNSDKWGIIFWWILCHFDNENEFIENSSIYCKKEKTIEFGFWIELLIISSMWSFNTEHAPSSNLLFIIALKMFWLRINKSFSSGFWFWIEWYWIIFDTIFSQIFISFKTGSKLVGPKFISLKIKL